jgi:hypothetical protein
MNVYAEKLKKRINELEATLLQYSSELSSAKATISINSNYESKCKNQEFTIFELREEIERNRETIKQSESILSETMMTVKNEYETKLRELQNKYDILLLKYEKNINNTYIQTLENMNNELIEKLKILELEFKRELETEHLKFDMKLDKIRNKSIEIINTSRTDFLNNNLNKILTEREGVILKQIKDQSDIIEELNKRIKTRDKMIIKLKMDLQVKEGLEKMMRTVNINMCEAVKKICNQNSEETTETQFLRVSSPLKMKNLDFLQKDKNIEDSLEFMHVPYQSAMNFNKTNSKSKFSSANSFHIGSGAKCGVRIKNLKTISGTDNYFNTVASQSNRIAKPNLLSYDEFEKTSSLNNNYLISNSTNITTNANNNEITNTTPNQQPHNHYKENISKSKLLKINLLECTTNNNVSQLANTSTIGNTFSIAKMVDKKHKNMIEKYKKKISMIRFQSHDNTKFSESKNFVRNSIDVLENIRVLKKYK